VRIAGSVPGFHHGCDCLSLLAATTGLMISALGRSVGATARRGDVFGAHSGHVGRRLGAIVSVS